MPLKEIEDILEKYKIDEERVDNLYKEHEKQNEEEVEAAKRKRTWLATYEEAKERNNNILKELEVIKGNLRSKAIFSPTEMQWEKICKKYHEEPSLAVTTWRCNLPVFV